MESSDRNVMLPKQDSIQWDKSREMFAQVPLTNEQLGTLACIGLTVSSLEAEEKTMRLLEFEISVIAISKVKGWVGRMKIWRTRKGWTKESVSLSEPGIWSLVLCESIRIT